MSETHEESGTASAAPIKVVSTGVDTAAPEMRGRDGRFVKGHPKSSAGRPRGYDFRAVVEQFAATNKVEVDRAIYEVFTALAARAKAGDVAAAKLLLDRLCTADPTQVEVLTALPEDERQRRVDEIISALELRRMQS